MSKQYAKLYNMPHTIDHKKPREGETHVRVKALKSVFPILPQGLYTGRRKRFKKFVSFRESIEL